MSEARHALLRAFIESDVSPQGKWWIDVPVGLSVTEENHPTIDAVCLTSREFELPESYPEHTGVPYVVHPDDEAIGVAKADAFESVRESGLFAEETVVLVLAVPGTSSIGLVGELLAYKALLEADWDWTIEELLVVTDTDDPVVNRVCRELGIRAVRVKKTQEEHN